MNPYQNLPDNSFWAPAVAQKSMFDILEIWDPKHKLGLATKVATYGSCFAQHIGRALKQRGYNWLVTEPSPLMMSEETAKKFNYGVFSARTGNIYTASLLLQWLTWARDRSKIPDEVWVSDGRYYDPFRPNIEPLGFGTREELMSSRSAALDAFRDSILQAGTFVFTMGLTESWFNRQAGFEYPMCPGVIAGEYNSEEHQFVNQEYPQIRQSLTKALRLMRAMNPDLRILLTVSPVPLTATNSGRHVLVANMASKSILRSVADSLARNMPFVDYFPSFEIITSPPFRGTFYEPNLRNVTSAGVAQVMRVFFECLSKKYPVAQRPKPPGLKQGLRKILGRGRPIAASAQGVGSSTDAEICEEEFLDLHRTGG